MCNCPICNQEIVLGQKTIETAAPNGAVFLSHRPCVDNAIANIAALRGSKPN